MHPQRAGIGPTPAQLGMTYSDVSFRTSDGLVLRGWWIPGDKHLTIVMVHGLGGSRRDTFSKAAYLHSAGYNLLVFDLRGHGRSDGMGTTMGYREPNDVRAAVGEARTLDPGPIVLFGYSLGAAVAVEEGAVDPRVNAVIEDSGFSSVGDVFMSRFTTITHLPDLPLGAAVLGFSSIDIGTWPWNVEPARIATQMHKPLLVIIGDADTVVPPAEGLAIYRAAAGPKVLLEVPGAGHVQAYFSANALYERTVLDFLGTALSGSSSVPSYK